MDRPWNRKFLGFTVSRSGVKLEVAAEAIDKLKDRVRASTRRKRGHRIVDIIGWAAPPGNLSERISGGISNRSDTWGGDNDSIVHQRNQ